MTPCVRFTDDVQLVTPPTPGGVRILGAADRLARILGKDVLVTCGTEGHVVPDPHCTGNAFDFGVVGLSDSEILRCLRQFQGDLGSAFYAQYEVHDRSQIAGPAVAGVAVINSGATGPHIHVQVSKGTTYPS